MFTSAGFISFYILFIWKLLELPEHTLTHSFDPLWDSVLHTYYKPEEVI